MSPPKIKWASAPLPSDRKYVEIVSARPKLPVFALITSSQLIGVYTHWQPPTKTWDKGRTVPCLGDEIFCSGCQARRSKRWKGYLGCFNRRHSKNIIVEVTAEAANACPALIDPTNDLRGKIIELERIGDKHNSPVMARVVSPPGKVYIPAAFNVHAQLARLWGFEELGWMGDDGGTAVGPHTPALIAVEEATNAS